MARLNQTMNNKDIICPKFRQRGDDPNFDKLEQFFFENFEQRPDRFVRVPGR